MIHWGPRAPRARKKFALAVDLRGRGDVEVEYEQGHGDGEDAVTERGEAVEVAALDAVVEGGHG